MAAYRVVLVRKSFPFHEVKAFLLPVLVIQDLVNLEHAHGQCGLACGVIVAAYDGTVATDHAATATAAGTVSRWCRRLRKRLNDAAGGARNISTAGSAVDRPLAGALRLCPMCATCGG